LGKGDFAVMIANRGTGTATAAVRQERDIGCRGEHPRQMLECRRYPRNVRTENPY
jgi:hypothetical protein